jgi:molybdopterin synthase catalytic subunit
MPRSPRITPKPIDPGAILESVRDDSAGGTVLFVGTIRNRDEGRRVEKLEYQAYRVMAERRMKEIESEVKRKWKVMKISMIHREGVLRVGEVSVAVAVSAEHRAEAFEAARFAIERVKHSLPVWKKEKLASGKNVWLEGVPIQK